LARFGPLTEETKGGHGHSHSAVEMPAEEGIVAMARGFLVVLALSIHDLFEGVALGVARFASQHPVYALHCTALRPAP
jgi:zinc transporter ZupT